MNIEWINEWYHSGFCELLFSLKSLPYVGNLAFSFSGNREGSKFCGPWRPKVEDDQNLRKW